MDKYIGCKMIEAEPINLGDYNTLRGWTVPADENPADDGYMVIYPDGYRSWSPKDQFEKYCLKVTPNPKLKTGCSISTDMVEGFIKECHVATVGEKTTIVRAVLVNGFEVIESSACVDPANYDEKIGADICINKIRDQIWHLLGFLLQTAVGGVK